MDQLDNQNDAPATCLNIFQSYDFLMILRDIRIRRDMPVPMIIPHKMRGVCSPIPKIRVIGKFFPALPEKKITGVRH